MDRPAGADLELLAWSWDLGLTGVHALGNVVNMALYGVPLAPAEAPLSLVPILLVWGLLVAVLTPVCTAWGRLKERRRDLRWLAYL